MEHLQHKMKQRHQRIRWVLLGVMILVVVIYEILEVSVLAEWSSSTWLGLDLLLVFILAGVNYFIIDRWLKSREAQLAMQLRLAETGDELEAVYRRQKQIFSISRAMADTDREENVIQAVLQLSLELIGAKGASFVPLDERAQPLQAMTAGEMPLSVGEAWLEYLASPTIRAECGACQEREALTSTCPLLKGAFSNVKGIYCLPVSKGEQELGVLNLYIPHGSKLESEQRMLLDALLDEASLALEGVRLRKQAMQTIHQLQAVQASSNLTQVLQEMLTNLRLTLEADFAMLEAQGGQDASHPITILSGTAPGQLGELAKSLLLKARERGVSLSLGKAEDEHTLPPGLHALMVVPLHLEETGAIGALLVARRKSRPFTNRQLTILQTIAGQAGLIIQNTTVSGQLKYRAIIDERNRLAREIHDGLAQTLGFLKLKMTQLNHLLEQGKLDQVEETAANCYEVISEAYLDVRQAIDGLRIATNGERLENWMQRIADEFSEYIDATIVLCETGVDVDLPIEVQSQLVRVVQEALSNVRKHAHASRVEIDCRTIGNDLVLEVRDDGVGFYPEDVPLASRYGLKGMHERAELIGADFQIISQPAKGTTIRLSLPLGSQPETVQN